MFELRTSANSKSSIPPANSSLLSSLKNNQQQQKVRYKTTVIPDGQKLDEILNDIECIQETKEHHVKIEFNWLINDILDHIDGKQAGEKIESEEFYYKKPASFINESNSDSFTDESDDENNSFYDNNNNNNTGSNGDVSLLQNFLLNRNSETTKSTTTPASNNNCNCCKRKSSLTSLSRKLSKNDGSLINELISEYFIENSNWQLELNINEYYSTTSTTACVENGLNEFISIHAILLASQSLTNNIIHELNIAKFKHLNDIASIDLIIKFKFYILDAKFENVYQMKTIEKGVNVIELLQNSLDLTNIKFGIEKYCNLNDLTGWLLKKNSKDFAFLCEFKIYNKNELVLKKSFKHVWTIRNWKVYLIENKGYNSNDIPLDHDNKAIFKQLFKFQSKSFHLRSPSTQDQTCKQRRDDEKFTKNYQKYIDYLLKQIKWKLQLYPRGYSDEYSNHLSLFLNFNEISKNLKDFTALKFDNRVNLNELSSASQHLFDHENDDEDQEYTNEIDMILLVKPKFNTNNAIHNKNQFLVKNFQETNNKLTETFVKACFQISIVDDKNKKIDICETDQQLFELYGSWGYKEYLLINDLIQVKEKYLKNGYKNLHLNCVIKLYYTITMKFPMNSQNSNNNHDLIKSYRKLSKYQFREQPNVFLCENLKYEHLNSLKFDLSYLFKSSHMYDLIIQAPTDEPESSNNNRSIKKYKHFKVHKLILSMRSIVFENMFNHHLITSTSNGGLKPIDALEIVDFNAYIVNLFLKYLYIDSIELDDESLFSESDIDDNDVEDTTTTDDETTTRLVFPFPTQNTTNLKKSDLFLYTFIELFKISDKYCVYKLRNLCELKLMSELNSKNLINLLIISHLYNSTKLKQHCFNYLAANLDTIVLKQKKKLNYLELNYPNLLAEAFRVLYLKDN